MRLMIINMLAAVLVLFGTASASAYAVHYNCNYAGNCDGWSSPPLGEVLTMVLTFDTEGASDIQLLSMSVIFDHSQFSYNLPAGAENPTYMFYVPVGRGFNMLEARPENGSLRVGTENQILFNFTNSDPLPSGNVGAGVALMATIEFTRTAVLGPAFFEVTAEAPGNVLQLGPLHGNAVVPLSIVPEPATAVLVGLGLLGLGVAGWRRA